MILTKLLQNTVVSLILILWVLNFVVTYTLWFCCHLLSLTKSTNINAQRILIKPQKNEIIIHDIEV